MFVFNPFFSHCSHCLTSIERKRSGMPPLPTWLSGSFQRGIPEHLLAPSTSFLSHPFPIPHCISVVCAVCFYFVFVFLFFSLLEPKWSETSHQLPMPPHTAPCCSSNVCQNSSSCCCLAMNEMQLSWCRCMFIVSNWLTEGLTEGLTVWLTGWLTEWLTKPHWCIAKGTQKNASTCWRSGKEYVESSEEHF